MTVRLKTTTGILKIPRTGNGNDRGLMVMRLLLAFAMLLLMTGCMTSQHNPVMFRAEADATCPDWSVVVEVDGRFYCVDRAAFEEEK